MGKIEKKRRHLQALYGHLYKRMDNVEWKTCYYCGGTGTLFDHCPAIKYVDGLNIERYLADGGKFLLIPCCHECNSALGAFHSTDLQERCERVYDWFTKKANRYDKLWQEDEIEDLGPNLKSIVLLNVNKMRYYQSRADQVAKVITDRFYFQ